MAVFLHESDARLRHVEQTLPKRRLGGVADHYWRRWWRGELFRHPDCRSSGLFSAVEREADAFAVAELQRHGLNLGAAQALKS